MFRGLVNSLANLSILWLLGLYACGHDRGASNVAAATNPIKEDKQTRIYMADSPRTGSPGFLGSIARFFKPKSRFDGYPILLSQSRVVSQSLQRARLKSTDERGAPELWQPALNHAEILVTHAKGEVVSAMAAWGRAVAEGRGQYEAEREVKRADAALAKAMEIRASVASKRQRVGASSGGSPALSSDILQSQTSTPASFGSPLLPETPAPPAEPASTFSRQVPRIVVVAPAPQSQFD